MQIKIFSPLWGHEHLDIADFVHKIKTAGYDGLETWLPEDKQERHRLLDNVERQELLLITHQHQARGADFQDFKVSFLHYLELSAEGHPLLINSHTGKDSFSFEQNLELVDLAAGFSAKKGLPVAHEIHRGRYTFHPAVLQPYLDKRPGLLLTADLSHWVNVTESFLADFAGTLGEAIQRTRHIHARIGFEEGPQVPDPRAPEWQPAVNTFFDWWDRIVKARNTIQTFTTEFGPPPYLPTIPFSNQPVADQFEINCYMKDQLRLRYGKLER